MSFVSLSSSGVLGHYSPLAAFWDVFGLTFGKGVFFNWLCYKVKTGEDGN